MRSLVVEDSANMRRLLEMLLRQRGHEVVAVADAETGLGQHLRSPFELMLVDWILPGQSGLELTRTVRKMAGGDGVIVLVLTGRDGPEHLEEVLDAGADDYIAKPLEPELLRTRILVAERQVAQNARRRRAEEALRRDLTERRRLQARMQFADRLASVGTLAAGVAHELNNPLAYVLSNLRLMSEELDRVGSDVPPGIRQTLQELIDESNDGATRMGDIVRDLKTFARADDENQGPIDLRPVIRSSINMASNELRHRAKLTHELEPTPRVEANESRIGQVVVNLLLNAAQALPEDRARDNEVRLRSYTDDTGWAVVEVEDTGMGIPAADLSRVFDPFFTTKPVGEGTGLGLSICHNIVKNAGGEITVKSREGEGTTVRVRLPAAERRPRRRASSLNIPQAQNDPRARVLVVDDEPLVAKSLRRALRDHDVTITADGAAAVDLLVAGESFDIILCDLMMPEVDGMDVYERVREAKPGVENRFVFMTGGAFTPKGRAFLDKVPNEHIEKPFDLGQVRRIVASHASG